MTIRELYPARLSHACKLVGHRRRRRTGGRCVRAACAL